MRATTSRRRGGTGGRHGAGRRTATERRCKVARRRGAARLVASPTAIVALGAVTFAAPSAAAARAPAASPSFLAHPTEQLGVPGAAESAEITPSGSIFTGRLELTVRAGPRLRVWNVPRRTLDARVPLYSASRRIDGLDHVVRAYADDDTGVPVVHLRVSVHNPTRRARRWRLGFDVGWLGAGRHERRPSPGVALQAPYRFPRPVTPTTTGLLLQPGDAFDGGWRYTWRGPVLERSGSVLLSSHAVGGSRVSRMTAPAPRADAVGARERFAGRVGAHSTRTVDHVIPLRAVPADSPVLRETWGSGLGRLTADWRPVVARAMSVRTPEPLIDRAWRNGLQALVTPRYRLADGRWIQGVNKLGYQASWIRDTVQIARALDQVGLHDEAGEDLRFLPSWQQQDGQLRSRPGQEDGPGQALWGFGDHAARTRDRAFAAAVLPSIDREMEWITARLATDPEWILPAGDPRDNESVAGHATGDLAWLAGGTRRVVGLARLLGDDGRAQAWSSIADRVARVARARIAEAARRGVVPPVLDARGGQRWGELWLAWPTGLLSPRDPLVAATMRAAARAAREGIGVWRGRLHLYLGIRRFETELRAGHRRSAEAGLYATVAHLTSTGGTWEQSSKPYGARDNPDAIGPHGWAAADLMSLIRDMLVREDGDGLRILDAVPDAWLLAGRRTVVRRAATEYGPVDVELRARRDGATLRWSAKVPAGTPLRFRAPDGVRRVRLPGHPAGRRTMLLPARSGTLRLRWRPPVHARDATDVRDALRRSYARRGRPW